ncbi:hypothetical protein [Halobellus sp. Atlit-38R]|uniref:hypothetical protein n=1 Tax=Halobellus sp. Atlit-38R TaxID=2282131 RepID=UPI00131418E2|nr:hypothetical protein [Halobellus sp. Atlit-38R]
MALFEFVVFWAPITFGFIVAATYVGTKLALRSYFEGENPTPSDTFRVDDDRED